MAKQFLNRQAKLPRTSQEIGARFAPDGWLMTDAERSALNSLLSELRPDCAIEVGTYKGGSLEIFAKYCRKVYSIDIDPYFRDNHALEFPNVDFIVGNSQNTLPALIQTLQTSGEQLGVVLIDADHSEQGVRRDLNNILKYRPVCPLYVIMHDSFNPGCRKGILTANWAENPHVHLVETDYIMGRFMPKEEKGAFRSMWCGFGLAIMLPEERQERLIVRENESLMYKVAYWSSVHPYEKVWAWFRTVPSVPGRLLSRKKSNAGPFLKNHAP